LFTWISPPILGFFGISLVALAIEGIGSGLSLLLLLSEINDSSESLELETLFGLL
jgi:hypothetical protein